MGAWAESGNLGLELEGQWGGRGGEEGGGEESKGRRIMFLTIMKGSRHESCKQNLFKNLKKNHHQKSDKNKRDRT